jgi:uncharacterized membrane protein YraQ (UPF0718 family)
MLAQRPPRGKRHPAIDSAGRGRWNRRLPLRLVLGALAPILCGIVLALAGRGPGAWLLGARALALSASLTVVLGALLPEATEELGAWALLGLLGGLLVPALAERLGRGGHPSRAAELGFLGLLLHQIVEGAALATAGRGEASGAVLLAVAAHTTPLVAVTLLGSAGAGLASLAWRGATLALATAVGLFAGGSGLPAGASGPLDAWVASVVSGLLLHVFGHDLPRDPLRTHPARAVELAATVGGIALPAWLLPGDRSGFLLSLLEIAQALGPPLLLGLGLGAVLQASSRPPAVGAHGVAGPGSIRLALRGLWLGARLPVCACDALPMAGRLAASPVPAALVVAFLLGTPSLGIETLLVSSAFLGPGMAAIRLMSAILLAFLLALGVHAFAARAVAPPAPAATPAGSGTGQLPAFPGGWQRRFVAALDEMVLHIGPWLASALVLAAWVRAFLPDGALRPLAARGADVPLAALLALPASVAAAPAVALAWALWGKGLSAGAALAGLLLGPLADLAGLWFLGHAWGRRAGRFALAAALAGTMLIAWAVPELAAPALPAWPEAVALAALLLLALMLLRSLWTNGVRGWLGALGALAAHEHGHPGHEPDAAPVPAEGHEHDGAQHRGAGAAGHPSH